MKKKYYAGILLLLLIGCKSSIINEDTYTKIIDVDFSKKSEKSPVLKLSDIIDSVTYVPIVFKNSDTSCIVGEIIDLKYYNENYYVLDNINSSIYTINPNGVIENILSCRGRASYEYITLNHFDVNPLNGEISVYDSTCKRIQLYSNNGNYIRSIPISDIVRDFAVLDNGDYLFYTPDHMRGSTRRGLWQTDSNGKFKKHLVEIDDKYRYGGLSAKYLKRIDDRTIGLMGEEDFDRIYHIKSDNIEVKYKFNLNIKLSKQISKNADINYWKHKGEVYKKHGYLETNNFMFVTINNFIDNILLFYNKEKDEVYQVKGVEDLVEDIKTFGIIAFCTNKSFINIVDPRYIANDSILNKKYPQVTENSNPVLVISHTK